MSNVRVLRYVAFANMVLWLLFTSASSQALSPHFGSDIHTLEGWGILLSPHAQYAAGQGWEIDESHVEIRLWDLRNPELMTPELEPSASVILEHHIPYGLLTSFEMQFSPDEQYLAIRKDFDLTILTVPDLQIHTNIDVSASEVVYPESLVWSEDSQLLATQGSGDLVIWDARTGALHRHPLDNAFGPIIATPEGWLITKHYIWSGELPATNAFSFCTRQAEQCTAYRIEELMYPESLYIFGGQPVVASPDGEAVLTYGRDDHDQVGVWAWRHESNEAYIRDESPLELGENITPKRFSPDGRYLSTYGNLVWNFKTLMPVQSGVLNPVFGPDSNYFVVRDDSDFALYRVGQEDPIDEVTNVTERMDPDALLGEAERQLSIGEYWVLYNVRHSAVLIPIDYR